MRLRVHSRTDLQAWRVTVASWSGWSEGNWATSFTLQAQPLSDGSPGVAGLEPWDKTRAKQWLHCGPHTSLPLTPSPTSLLQASRPLSPCTEWAVHLLMAALLTPVQSLGPRAEGRLRHHFRSPLWPCELTTAVRAPSAPTTRAGLCQPTLVSEAPGPGPEDPSCPTPSCPLAMHPAFTPVLAPLHLRQHCCSPWHCHQWPGSPTCLQVALPSPHRARPQPPQLPRRGVQQ